jgi:hypothetical protein
LPFSTVLLEELALDSFPLTCLSVFDVLVRASFFPVLFESKDLVFLIVDSDTRLASPRSDDPSIFLSRSLLLFNLSGVILLASGLRGGRLPERLILPSFLTESSLRATFEILGALS